MTTSDGRDAELLAMADEFEAGTAKAIATGYEEFGPEFQRKRKLLVDALRSVALPKQSDFSREELLAVVDKIRGGTRDGWGYGRDECADFITRLAAKPAEDGVRLKEASDALHDFLQLVRTDISRAAGDALKRLRIALHPPTPTDRK